MSSLRRITPIALPADVERSADYGEKPKLLWVAPTSLLVDDTYQRDLNVRSIRLITRVVSRFKWRRTKPPICVRVGKGLHIVDGQHTAIAAATLGIPKILVFLVDASDELERADSFVSHNQDRLTMAPLDVYRAKVGAKDPDAVRIQRVCSDAGVRLKVISHVVQPKVGDSAAIAAIGKLTARRGPAIAAKVLSILVRAGRAPVSSAEIAAIEEYFCGEGVGITEAAMVAICKELGADGLLKCQARASTDRISTKVAILDEYRRLAKKRK